MKKILVAEDNASFMKLLLLKLKQEGYETMGVSRGDEAINVFDDFGPNLLILDGLLPGKNGFEVAEDIRKRPSGKNIPIVLLTGVYKESEFYKFSKEIGVNLFYDKSKFSDKKFLEEIKKLLS